MTDRHADGDRLILLAVEAEAIVSFLALGPSGTRVILLNGKSSWKSFRKHRFLFPSLSPSCMVPEQLRIILQWTHCLTALGQVR